ncbi:stage II sporulation protein E [[Clostridium] polysaccharolyticum]|uniref:Stage II sporulation protein E n=1 Tax=[Clostridium] polysaccharolyticum TaxID=29364 RepID=A0A1I0E939_9FIRM|nr:stage II sporulation protein E [[Clostridium] polysaccharolyticum]SET41604.1 stage II sporulation protein E [[Clostridium] polysaccharolyticum]
MKKLISTLRGLELRGILISLIGIIMSRTMLFDMNPIAIGYFAAAYAYKKSRPLLTAAMLAGLYTIGQPVMLAKYGLIMLVVAFVTYISEKKDKILPILALSILSGLITMAFSISNGLVVQSYKRVIVLGLLEGVLVMSLANMFYLAIDFIRTANSKQLLTNQELISVAILGGAFLYGLPDFSQYSFSVVETAACLLIVAAAYKYGAGAGAVTGAACGIVLGIQSQDVRILTVFCLTGIGTGVFRELGRIVTSFVFALLNIVLCYFTISPDFLEVVQIRALVSATLVFLLLPKPLMEKVDLYTLEPERKKKEQNLQEVTMTKLREFSDSFVKLSKSFYSLANARQTFERDEVQDIFAGLSAGLCKDCKNCSRCWEKNYYHTQQTAEAVLEAAKGQGYVRAEDFPRGFKERCIHFEQFVSETNRGMTVAALNMNWSNRMAESRVAIAGQLNEVASIIDDFSRSLNETAEVRDEKEDLVKKLLRAYQLDVKRISVIEKRNNRKQLYVNMRTRKGRCVTTKEAADILTKVYGKKIVPAAESKNIIGKEYDKVSFVEDTKFQVFTGMARTSKDGEIVSGDTFSFMNLDSGETVMILSDGMGTGERASEESELVIELLEQFLEAGFTESSAIKLINSILVVNSDDQTVSTLDISSINLFTGVCSFIKIGASTTFIKRNGWIETIQSTNLPVGMFNEIDIEGSEKKLYDGDYVIMVSDGILDFVSGVDKEEIFKEILEEMDVTNPQEMADTILKRILEKEEHGVRDDMTVLVAGFWEKSN